MKKIILPLSLLFFSYFSGQSQKVEVVQSPSGFTLNVDQSPFIINGMNWDYYPVGTNFSYSLWKQPDNIITAALDREMTLLKKMGVNTIRQYVGVPPKWIKYIYEKYGIYTMLNHPFGRYGLTVNGTWVQNTDYFQEATQKQLLKEVKEIAETYRNTPGILVYLIGNENNYGLFWDGAETENIPVADRKSTHRAKAMYQLMNEAAKTMKLQDSQHPVAICNGDLMFLDIIGEECKDVDIFGTNMYRGASFDDAFERVLKETGKPIMFTEFGSDAYNELKAREDQTAQANYDLSNWKEIYANAAGMGKTGNSLGGFTFQFSDGWWKYKQTSNLDVHDTNASWSNAAYGFDYAKGRNNMNEEWFGICAKGLPDEKGLYNLYPRATYYSLQKAHAYNPYHTTASLADLENYFGTINNNDSYKLASANRTPFEKEKKPFIELSRLTGEFSSYVTGGSLITTPEQPTPGYTSYPDRQGFDHMESFYAGVRINPTKNFTANAEVNALGNVARNPIDEIFYENRGRAKYGYNDEGDLVKQWPKKNLELYKASFDWNTKYFDLTGFYRTGHYHWGYEGDFFGLYPEANYGPYIDMYNGKAPYGMEFTGKSFLDGLKVAYGPQLWWGANPAIIGKIRKNILGTTFTAIYHEDLDEQNNTVSSFAVPLPRNRRATLVAERKFGNLGVSLGGIWSGQPRNGQEFQLLRDGKVYKDVIKPEDNWGGKIKLTYTGPKFNWYLQSAIMGLVASGGADYTQTFAGWTLKDSGMGNQYNVLAGATFLMGNWQIAPNFLWQKPIEGPIPGDVIIPGRPRNFLDDPFAVRSNREMTAGELLLTYDPTPATWMYSWDSDMIEDAPLAMSVGFVYRHLPTTQDAAIGIMPDGRTTFAFPGAPPAKDLWEAKVRLVSRVNSNTGLIANIYGGTNQANGSDPRTIERFGADLKLSYKRFRLMYGAKFNDWGPYDYHRDFNQTFPFQTFADLSTTLSKREWFILPNTRVGIRGTYRSLDKYSPRYAPVYAIDAAGNFVPDPNAIGFPYGNEWEVRTYIQINLGK